jgi:glycine C-acetyltransferase
VFADVGAQIEAELSRIRDAGLQKNERIISSAQGAVIRSEGAEVINLCANNYLGLADHPEITAAAHAALDRWGYGLASVRFICGTQEIHRALESELSDFLGTEDTVLFGSCFDANTGLFEILLTEDDAVISDELNHASIIDGIRLSKARRLRYSNGDMDELETRLREAHDARRRLIATDGVFSMDGYGARLRHICDLADRYGAMVMVDDSHAVGFVGSTGRGTPELHEVIDRVDILTGTLGKALGGASGGYVSGRGQIVALLRQRSRPYLFSNAVPPPVAAASLKALEIIQADPALRERLRDNTARFRTRMVELGIGVLPGDHPIVPVMFGDAQVAADAAQRLLRRGVYAIAFSYPVVPAGMARIRTQVSAAHSPADLDRAADAFRLVRAELGERMPDAM